jgi:peptidoglycan biosynthesis protein MviN/MurJ (putative lipid II flippase)
MTSLREEVDYVLEARKQKRAHPTPAFTILTLPLNTFIASLSTIVVPPEVTTLPNGRTKTLEKVSIKVIHTTATYTIPATTATIWYGSGLVF